MISTLRKFSKKKKKKIFSIFFSYIFFLLISFQILKMSPPKEKGTDGHAASREKICIVCLKKADRKLTPNQIEGLTKFTTIFESITLEDPRVPTGICNTCKSILSAKMQASQKGKTNDRVFKIPEGFTFDLHFILPRTRSEEKSFCNCLLCQVSSKQRNAIRGLT